MLTIWEFRSPMIIRNYIKKIAGFNYNQAAKETYSKFHPLNTEALSLDKWIKEWGSSALAKLPILKNKLIADQRLTGNPHEVAFEALKLIQQNFLCEGFESKFRSMIPREYTPVVAHNDGNINNALVTLKDNEKLILIDYEYCGWNPPAFDLAAFMTAMAID